MKYSEAKQGRVFIIRLEDGDILHESIEAFAQAHSVKAAALIVLGGADQGSKLVVGPEQGRSRPIVPLEHILRNVHEVTGTGTLFPNVSGQPFLHMHLACGREGETITGCVRRGVKVWHVMEVILWELTDTSAQRLPDQTTGFDLLQP
ncbi:MAG: DNA-binding protein [Desulfobacteraceae bacterium]|nr:MAG: DNA-binding protein [Desulfobacteraceae bacterium]